MKGEDIFEEDEVLEVRNNLQQVEEYGFSKQVYLCGISINKVMTEQNLKTESV